MKDVMGIIYTGENDARLRELTIIRAIAALPVAGRFRVIDFLVSSMVNGGMKNIGVIMQKNYHSLMDHLGSGKEWDLHGKTNGLHILPPFLTRENVGLYPGVLDGLRSNTDYLNRSKQELVVLSNSNIIYNAHFKDMIAFYENTGADITLMYTKDPIVLSTGRYKLVSFRIWINPNDPKPPGPDKWLSPVWIDAETGTVVPPQIPNWESLSIERLKAIVMGWSPEMRDTQDWTWTAEHVSGFARIVVRDSAPPSDNIWVEDGEPMVLEIWVDEAREAVIGAFEL